jgi:hypothetical protein
MVDDFRKWFYTMIQSDAIVLGGGPTMESDYHFAKNILKMRSHAIIAANHHYKSVIDRPDTVCFVDDISRKKHPLNSIKKTIWTVSIRPGQCDETIEDFKDHGIHDSGSLAAWYALKNFSGTVYLCGYDLREAQASLHIDACKKWGRFYVINKHLVNRLCPVSGVLAGMS